MAPMDDTEAERLRSFSMPSPAVRQRRELLTFARRLGVLLLLVSVLLVAGTIGFMATTPRGAWDGFVLSLDTVATVGSIPSPENTSAEIVKVLLIVLGVGTLFYALVTVTEFFVAGHLAEILA